MQAAKAKSPDAVDAVDSSQSQEPATPSPSRAHEALTPELRHSMISEAAYRRYAERGYVEGDALDDWLQAEAQIDQVNLDPGQRPT